MTTTNDQQVLEALKTRLDGPALGSVAKPASLSIERSRLAEIHPTQLPAAIIYPQHADTVADGFLYRTTMDIKIAIHVKKTTGNPVDSDVDSIWRWVRQQLLADESLGGLVVQMWPLQRQWGFALHEFVFGDMDVLVRLAFNEN